jgi:hypothetical protein
LKLRKQQSQLELPQRFSVRWRKRGFTFSLCSCGIARVLQGTSPLLYPLSYGGLEVKGNRALGAELVSEA